MSITSRMTVSALWLVFYSLVATADPVVDDRQWRQLTATSGLTWDRLALGDQPGTEGDEGGACPPGGGLCSGSIGSVSFDGWTWATSTEVADLFRDYAASYQDGALYVTTGDPALTAFLTDFEATATNEEHPSVRVVEGWTADQGYEIEEWNNIPYDLLVTSASVARAVDTGVFRTAQEIPSVLIEAGAWLYRPASDSSVDASSDEETANVDTQAIRMADLPVTCPALTLDGAPTEAIIHYGISTDGISYQGAQIGGATDQDYHFAADISASDYTDIIVVVVIGEDFLMLGEDGLVPWDGQTETLLGLPIESWNAEGLPLSIHTASLSDERMSIYIGFHNSDGELRYCPNPMMVDLAPSGT